ncbi:DUF4347 domain-containing protein [Duganella sp. FT109W]|uniref:DUF4347 domain-containing protein n=1 Tax=Duganella margarita TaxID=2692170 RepID=A0ABW9WCF6_9BURK|nr:Ig-like domain-containing protein [Duganella margarita]MYN38119.1 DUF4347 domain-containing protein [Duganella margarita]
MSSPNRTHSAVLFIDASVVNADALAAGVADDVLVVKLASWRDGVEQIATVLRNHAGLDSIQIVSHGAAGQLQLGNTVLDNAHLEDYQAAVREWGAALSDGGDLLLFGCDVAAGAAGQSFVDALSFVSGADVAASTDITGVHGNWELEYHSGAIEAASALSAAAEQAYAADLALVNNGSNGTITFGTNANVTLLNATGLAAGTVVHTDNILGLGLDLYAQSTNGGGVQVVNVNGSNLIGVPLSDDRLTVNGSLLSPVSYVDLRANSGVFDAVSLNLGSGSLVGNLLGTVVFTVYALDANYQPTGVGVSLTSLLVNEYGLLNFASMADFKGIYGIRIVNPLGFEVAIDDLQIANARVANSITSAAYNAGTGVLSLTAVGIRAGDAIDPTKLTITGANGATYTLTSSVVSASSTTAASITLNAADKLALNGLLNNNGSSSVDGKTFNIAAAANWDSNLSNGTDLTGNPIAVTNVQLPTISAASYNAATHVLTVTGANLVGVVGANNDITVAKLGLTGEGGVTRFLNTSSNVEVNSSTSFSVTLSGADIAAVEALLNKNGSISAGGTAYSLSAGDDWNSVIGNANTAVSAAIVVVNNTSNSAPTITGTATAGVGDNATIKPFSGVTVADVNGDNVSMTISFNAANGTLSGAGLSGSNGSYTLSAATPAALTAALKALTFTPTANQAAVGVNVSTTFTMVATDANGAAVTNTATVITATSVNDAPVLAGTAAAQNVTAGGTLHPFSAITLSDPDVGASVIVTITPDSAAKGAFTPASLSASGFVTTDGGVTYTLSAAAPGAAQAALQALIFKSAAGVSATTTFTVAINDGSVIVSNSATTVVSAVPSGTTALGVTFSADTGVSNTDLITQSAAQNITGTLSSALLGNEKVEVSLDNGSTWTTATAATGSTSWALNGQTLSGSGTLQVRVTNPGGSSTPLSASYSIDNTAPATTSASVAFSADTGVPGDLITKTAAQTISGTLSANLAADEHVEVSLNNGSTWVTASGSTGSAAWSLAGQTLTGSNTLQVRVVDAAGNAGAAASSAYQLDTTAPTVSLSSNVSVLKSGERALVTLTFSETPDGLALGDLTASGGTLANLVATANPRVYTVEFTPNAGLSGVLGSVTLTNNSYADLAGNNGSGATSSAISITTLGPGVVITSDAATLKTGETANITFTFTSAPSGFSAGDISVSGGAISGLTNQGGGVYTALFTPGANVSAPATITVASGSYTDALGNQGGSGVTPVILVDTKAPTLAITSDLASLNAGSVANITFTFSETPLGFTSADVAVSGGVLSGFSATANPLVYTALFTPSAGIASGAASITVAGGSYTDLIGNSGTAAPSPAVSIDTVAPGTTGASFTFSNDTGVSSTDLITRTAAQTVSGTLNAALVAGETVQVSLDNGATWSNAGSSVGSASWSLGGVTLSGSNTLQVRVNDAAGNHGAAAGAAYVLDTAAPTVLATSDLGALRAGQSATLTFTFSEAPSNFSAASLTVTGGSVSGLAATGNPLVYTATFTPAAGQLGVTATVQVNAGGYIDAAGNNGQASLTVPIAINTTLPSLLISADDVALKAGEAATLTFTFSTPPAGFTSGDIVYNNGTLSGFTATANPLVYTAVFTPNSGVGGGTADISVGAGAYTDAFGNSGSGATGPVINIDTLAPTVAITSNVTALKAGETATVSFTFSELPVGFGAGDVVTAGGTLSGLAATANPLVYTATFTPTAGIQNTAASITIAAGAFTDAAGNAAGGALTPPIAIDTLAPTAVANTVLFSIDHGSSSTDLVTNASAQDISGTLAAPLGSGEYVEVSLDNGASWSTATGAGSAWSLAGQTLTASDTLKVRVTDAAGNHGAAYAVSYVLDATPPTATISSNVAAVKAGETATITFTFSEAPSGFGLGDISAANGVLSNLSATANPLVYTATYTPAVGVNGVTDNITLTAGSYTDQAGNAGGGASSPGIGVDTLAPLTSGASVVFSSDGGTPDLVTNVAAQDLSGTLSANLAAGETVEVSLNNGATWVSASASAGSNGWTLAGQTLTSGAGHTVQVRVSDAAGNHSAAHSVAYTLDQTAPTLAISTSKAVLNSADAPLITFTFSEAPLGFGAGSVAVSGGTLTGFTATANPLVYTAVFTPTAGQAAGIGSVTVAAGAYTDLAGNSGQAGATPNITYATVAPGVAIFSDVSALKAGDTANITFKFSSAPTGFGVNDIVVGGGTLSGLTATADPLVYTAVFSVGAGIANGSGAVSVSGGSYTDSLGNLGVGGSMAPIAIDTLAPSLLISSNAIALNSSGTAVITFTFSETPAAFTLGDISATNGAVSNLVQTANPLVYTAVFTPAANVAAGSAVISVTAGAYADLAGNGGNAGVSPAISIDTLAPLLGGGSVLFSADTGSSSTDLITRTPGQNIAGTLNGGVLAVGDVVEVSLDNGASWTTASAPPGGASWSLFGQTLNGNGALQVRVSDANGNHGAVSTHTYLLDVTAPTVVVSSDTSTLKAGQSATISFIFSEAPSGFTLGDLIATGGTLSGFAATSNPLVYTVVLTPTPGFNGSASVTLGNNLYTDTAGNDGSGASSPAISVDTLAPTLAITSSASALKVGETATVTFTFSDAPTGFALGSISASNGALSGLTATSNPLVYTATFTPGAGIASGNAVISVAGSVYGDAAGNQGVTVSSAPIALDTLAPTASGLTVAFSADNGVGGDLVTNAISQVLTGTLSAPVGAGEYVQVSLDNGATWMTAASTAPGQWALTPQLLSGSGTLQVRVSDAAGNHGSAFSAGYVLDLVAPSMTITSSATTLKGGDAATLTFTFSEAPTGFALADLVAVNGTLSGFAASANPLVYTVVLTPAAGLAGASAGVTLAPGLYSDLAGNLGGGAVSPPITVDTQPPVLSIASSAASLKIGESATITFTFSELPVGFTLGDIAVSGGTLSGFGLTANPLVYTALFTPTPGVSAGSGTIVVAAGSFLDGAGNAGAASAITPINYSTQAPNTGIATVAFSSDTGLPNDLITTNPVQTVHGTLDANVQTGQIVEVSTDNGLNWVNAVAPVGGSTWTMAAPLFLNGSGTLQVRVTDAAGNHGAAYSAAYAIDVTAPTVAISSNVGALKGGESATITFTFNELPQNFTAADIVVPPGSGSITGFTVTANPLVYTAQFTPAPGYSLPAAVSLTAGSYTDTAGNLGLGAASSAISIDAAPPTLTISSSLAALKIGDTATITFTFSELPAGFAAGDVTATGGTLSGFTVTANPLVYTAVFTPTPGVNAGSAAISVAPNVYSDAAGNGGLGSTAPTLTLDTLAPLSAATGVPTFSNDTGVAGDLITFNPTQTVSGSLSAPLAAGEVVQVSFDNGASWQNATVSAASWSLAHTLTGSGVMQVRVADAAGNYSAASVTPYVFDQTTPTVTISSNMAVANGVTPAQITFTFSEPPSGFSSSNISVAGGTLGTLTATSDPKVFTASFTPTPGVPSGTATITVSGYTDTAGNGGVSGAIPSLQIDTVAPVAAASGGVTFSSDTGTGGDLITNNPVQNLSGNLSAPLAGGEVVQVSLDGGLTWHQAAVSGTVWSLSHTLLPGTRMMVVRVADAAGNISAAHSVQYTVDTTAPTLTATSSGGTVAQGGVATITLTLSDPAVLTQGDIVVAGGVITGFSGSGSTYTVIVTPPSNSTTPITVSVGGNLFTDAAGNGNAASAPLVVSVNTNPATNPGTPSTVDGVLLTTVTGIDARTGLATRTINVPTVTTSRPEDTSTEHAHLADIPIGIAASGANPGTSLVVSLPVGVGFEAAGPSSLLGGSMALTDLIGRIDDHTAAGQATRVAMEAQAQEFLAGLAPNVLLQHATLTMSAASNAAAGVVIVDGSDLVGASGGPAQHATVPDHTATALVIDARALPQGIGLQLDDVHFAAIIGAATVTGGAGDNFFIGDGEAQRFVLTSGNDNDTLYGNGGDDILLTAAGNDYLNGGDGADQLAGGAGNDALHGGAGGDVVQGGRSDTGQWQFYLKDGKVVGIHQTALANASGTETLTAAEINQSEAILKFVGASATKLDMLSLMYHAAFDRAPDLAGLNWWVPHNLSVQQQAEGFLQAPEAVNGIMTLSNHDYVAALLHNALGTTPDASALAPYLARLDAVASGDLASRAGVLADIALSSVHRAAYDSGAGLALGGQLLTQEQGWIANSGDDRLEGGAGNDLLVGGDDADTIVYSGAASQYSLALSKGGDVMVAEPDSGIDTIRQIELGEFNGVTRDLSFTQAGAGTLQELGMLYHLTLGRAGDLAGFLHWLGSGLQGSALGAGFIESAEFHNRFGAMDDNAFINLLYHNAGQQADSAALARWDGYLDSHSRYDLTIAMAHDVTLVGSQFGANGMSLVGSL